MSQHQFHSEIGQLLDLITHSLYSNREIFLRELVSNASDALDRFKYLTLTEERFRDMEFAPRIDIRCDEEGTKLTVADNGIGMDDEDLRDQLGTIARSGTKRFLSQLSEAQRKDANLIGQFGVGFYSAFMVADRVDVLSRKAGEGQAWFWSSDGKSHYRIEPAEKPESGTLVTLHLNEAGREFAPRFRVEEIIDKYSNHIAFPIYLHYQKRRYDDTGKEKSSETVVEQINSASALWKRPKAELTPEDYRSFYKTIAHDDEDPLCWLHVQAEGALEYTTLFYIPRTMPIDLYRHDYRAGIKLYIRRIFITDDDKQIMPSWLRFLRGIIDSEDLPLNVSRELLQQNRIVTSIQTASVKRILNELSRLAHEEAETYERFVEQYNRLLLEGLYQDFANRDTLLELVRFRSTHEEGLTSLSQYMGRMLADQQSIYYLSGSDEQVLRASPLLEAYTASNIEVLLMDNEIDDLVIPVVGSYNDIAFKPINRSDAGSELQKKRDRKSEQDIAPVIETMKQVLGDRVKDVVASARLAESPSCIVMDESDPSMKMQEMLKALGQSEAPEIHPILEINPTHLLVRSLLNVEDRQTIEDISFLLLEQALLVEKVPLQEPVQFVKRLNRMLEKVG